MAQVVSAVPLEPEIKAPTEKVTWLYLGLQESPNSSEVGRNAVINCDFICESEMIITHVFVKNSITR